MPDLSRIEAVTFDCYGTLIDWEAGILGALRPLLAARGVHPADDEILRSYAVHEAEQERGEYRSYRDVLEIATIGLASDFGFTLDEREVHALPESLPGWAPFADTVAALKRLFLRKRLVVCSNIDDDLFRPTWAKLGAVFEWVVTASYCRSYKPDPRHFRVALALLDLPADRVLHVAQSLYHDIAPARALGMPTVWVNRYGRAGGATPESAGVRPDLEVADLASVAALFDAR